MVGIVLVSQNRTLAAGVKEFALQHASTAVSLAIAFPDNGDADFAAALETVDDGTGILVLTDWQRTRTWVKHRLAELPHHRQAQIRLCDAPFVEGAIAAAAETEFECALAAANRALNAKSEGLTPFPEAQTSVERSAIAANLLGLHTRRAAQLVTLATRFRAEILLHNLTRPTQPANANSINQLMLLDIRQGDDIEIAATGNDAERAAIAMQRAIETPADDPPSAPSQGDRASPPAADPDADPQIFHGTPASPGIAIGPLVSYHPALSEIADDPAPNPDAEWHSLQSAVQAAQRQIQDLARDTHFSNHREELAIFQAHLLYLDDPALLDRAEELIYAERRRAPAAWQQAIVEMASAYDTLDEPYLQERAEDVKDIGIRVLQLLVGQAATPLDWQELGILVARNLSPSDMARLEPDRVLGICTVEGSATAHSALIAKIRGIPTIVGVGEALLQLETGVPVAMDAKAGRVWVQPSEDCLQQLRQRQEGERHESHPFLEAVSRDGIKIPIFANAIDAETARIAYECGAAGIGLLRTEFLYLDRLAPPSEDEQFDTYCAIAKTFSCFPVTIRTMDLGGDKSLPYLDGAIEPNPFLGWRGIRQSLDCPQLLETQLRAVLRASADYPVRLMFPMVASACEIRQIKQVLVELKARMRQAEIPFNEKLPVGIMVEVPAAVTMADRLAAEVDFFSIGTNDLSQYVMASDRANPKVARLADALEPAVLRSIRQTVTAAREAEIEVSVCGELASDPIAVPILLGLGVDELSVNPPAIASIKAEIARWDLASAEAVALRSLDFDSADAVRDCLHNASGEGG
jgi:phosphocarrier protein FPr